MDSTVRNIAIDGMRARWGAERMWILPAAIIEPQVAVGNFTDRPRKASDPSATITAPMATRPKAMIGRATFGSSSLNRMRLLVAPIARAASTYSRWETASVVARATRV